MEKHQVKRILAFKLRSCFVFHNNMLKYRDVTFTFASQGFCANINAYNIQSIVNN